MVGWFGFRFGSIIEIGPAVLLGAAKRCLLGPAIPDVLAPSLRHPAPTAMGTAFTAAVSAVLTSVWGVSHSQEWLNPNAVRKELQPLQRNDLIADVAARQPHDPASNLVFRQAVDKDVDALVALEAHARPMFRVGESGIRLRLRTFPEGVLVLEADKAVVAAIFAIRVEEGAEAMVYSTIERSHTSSGNTIQLIHIIANPTHRHLMDRFHKFITQTFWQIEGISSIFAITHTVGFDDSVDGSDYQEYVSSGMDRNIFFHRSHGALVEGIVDGFCLEDKQNSGRGVAIRYRGTTHSAAASNSDGGTLRMGDEGFQHASGSAHSESTWLEAVKVWMHSVCPHISFEGSKGWLELGFDSVTIMQLHDRIESETASLPISFLWEHNTPAKVANALTTMLSETQPDQRVDSEECQNTADRGIGIVGIACRLPGRGADCEDADALWEVLSTPCENEDLTELRSPEMFDAAAFGISPKEARAIDPKQR